MCNSFYIKRYSWHLKGPELFHIFRKNLKNVFKLRKTTENKCLEKTGSIFTNNLLAQGTLYKMV